MIAYIRFVIRRPIFTLIVFACITIILGTGILKLQFDTTVEAFLPKQDTEYKFYNEIKKIYGDTDTYVIFAVSHDHLFSREAFGQIDKMLSDIEEFRKYDAAREQQRLRTLAGFLDRDAASWGDLFGRFADDPVYQRFIFRTLKDNPDMTQIIGKREIRRLYKKAAAAADLKQRELIDEIVCPLNAKDIIGENDTLQTIDLISKDGNGKRLLPANEAEFAHFKRMLERNPAFERGIYSRNPKTGEIQDFAVIVRFRPVAHYDNIAREVLNISKSYTGLKIIPQGQPLIYIWINDYVQRDLFRLLSLAMAVAIAVCFLNFGSIRGVALPLTCLGMATVWVLGLMGYLGFKITTVGVSIPPLMIVVGSSYSIHVLHQYYADFDMISHHGKAVGLLNSMHHIGYTVFLAGLTTLVSFLTVANHQLSGMREWGIFSAIGVAFAILISVSVIPASLALMPHRKGFMSRRREAKSKKPVAHRIIGWMTIGALQHPKKVLGVVGILLVISVAGMFRIKIETEFLQNFKLNDPIRTSEKVIGEKFGGRWGFNILIDSGRPNGVKSAAYLRTLDDTRQWLESDKNRDLNVGRTDAFPDFIKTMNMAMNNDDRDYFSVPDNDMDISDYLELYSDDDKDSDGRQDSFEPYVDNRFQTCNMLTRIYQKEDYLIGTWELKRIFGKITEHLKQTLPKDYTFRITGHPAMVIKSAGYIADGQIRSLWQSWLVVGLAILILVRSLKAGLLALIPLSVAFIMNFGIMGLTGIRLDVATSIIAAITIGIGDDNTIHFINTYIFHRKQNPGAGFDELISATLASTGEAIIFTSLALLVGFSVFVLSSFRPVILFGVLMAVAITATNIGALLVLPAIIKVFRLDLKHGKTI